jgi:cell shape-determining protein MreD
MGAVHVSQARGLITLITLMVVGVQLAVFTQLRFAGVVVMLVWLWPVAVGLTGLTSLALFTGLLSGILFDAQSATPFGLSALVGLALAYFASRLGKEGVGDLDSAALWVTPALAAAAGFVAPLLYVISGVFALDFSLWHGSLLDSMLVNAAAFFVLARPMTRVAFAVSASAMRVRR